MNSKQAKQIPIEHFLNKLNHKPVKSSGDDLWYKSPLHEDNTPSFKVNKILNSWYDFGIGEGGSIIDLVCTMYNDDVSHAPKGIYGLLDVLRSSRLFKVEVNGCSYSYSLSKSLTDEIGKP